MDGIRQAGMTLIYRLQGAKEILGLVWAAKTWKPTVGYPVWMGKCLGIWDRRNHTALRWDSVPREGHPEMLEPRNHITLRGSVLDRGIAVPR